MTIEQKLKILQAEPEDGMTGDESDVRAFFASERARKDAIYKKAVLSEKVDSSSVPAEKPIYKGFSVIAADTYAKGVAKMKAKGQVPFSHEENVEARVLDYEAKGNESELFGTYLDSVTGFAYKAHSTKFKVSPVCDALVAIKPKFDKNFLLVDYDSFNGTELDSKDPNVKYNQDLTREEAKVHPAHLAAMNGNKDLWGKYVDLWFDKTGRTKGMGVYVRENTSEDQLRSAVLYDGNNYSIVGSSYDLDGYARFVSGAQ